MLNDRGAQIWPNSEPEKLIKLQDELIKSKEDQVETVQKTVKSEIKSLSDDVQ